MNLPSETAKFESVGDIYLEQSTLMLRHDTIVNLISFRNGKDGPLNYQAYWKHLPTGTLQHVRTDVSAVQRPIKTFENPWTALREAIDAAYNWIDKQATQQP